MKKLLVLLILVVVGALGVTTCPNKEDHVETIMEAVNGAMQKKASEAGVVGGLLGNLMTNLVGNLASNVVESAVEYHNYFVCSTCTVPDDGKDKVVSLGLLNHVFTVSKEDLLEQFQ